MKEESGLVPEKLRVRRCRGKGLAKKGWRTHPVNSLEADIEQRGLRAEQALSLGKEATRRGTMAGIPLHHELVVWLERS